MSWGGGCDEILAGFSLWCELQRESSVPNRFPAHPFVPRVLPLSNVKTSWAQRSRYPTVSSGSLTVQFLSIPIQQRERAGSRGATEALQKRPWGFVEHGRADGLWRMLSYNLRSKTDGGRGGWAEDVRHPARDRLCSCALSRRRRLGQGVRGTSRHSSKVLSDPDACLQHRPVEILLLPLVISLVAEIP